MKKIAFTLEIPDTEPRKKQPPVSKVHRDKKSYSRKTKHKARQEQTSPDRNYSGDFFAVFLAAIPQNQSSGYSAAVGPDMHKRFG